jgi:aspartate aminotransferase
MDIAERMKNISPSVTLTMDARVKQLQAGGTDIINFSVGEPDFRTPEVICEAAQKAIQEGFHKYTPVGGILSLREKIGKYLYTNYGVSYNPNQIIVSCGAKHSLYNAILALVNPGDEVLIPVPFWGTYPEQVKLAGGVPVFVNCPEANQFKLDLKQLAEKITPKTKVLILNYPNNPTGATLTRSELEKLAEIIVQNNIWVLSDEIYSKLTYNGDHCCFSSISNEIYNRTILINGVSKTFSMTGWRIGYAAGAPSIIKAMTDLQSHSTSNPTSISQKASEAALQMDETEIQKMISTFRKRRDLISSRLNQIAGVHCLEPEGAFYVFPNVSKILKQVSINTTLDFSEFLLEKAQIAVTPGEAFGFEGYLRISYATSEKNIEEGIRRFSKVI